MADSSVFNNENMTRDCEEREKLGFADQVQKQVKMGRCFGVGVWLFLEFGGVLGWWSLVCGSWFRFRSVKLWDERAMEEKVS